MTLDDIVPLFQWLFLLLQLKEMQIVSCRVYSLGAICCSPAPDAFCMEPGVCSGQYPPGLSSVDSLSLQDIPLSVFFIQWGMSESGHQFASFPACPLGSITSAQRSDAFLLSECLLFSSRCLLKQAAHGKEKRCKPGIDMLCRSPRQNVLLLSSSGRTYNYFHISQEQEVESQIALML